MDIDPDADVDVALFRINRKTPSNNPKLCQNPDSTNRHCRLCHLGSLQPLFSTLYPLKTSRGAEIPLC